MAELIRQSAEVRRQFARAIEHMERRRREESVSRLERAHPVVGKLLAPIANLMLFDEDLRNWERGVGGETSVARALRRLPSPWCYLNNVVLERAPGEYMQIDHVVVGPPGVAAIETKNWRGAILGRRDVWKVRSTGGWSRVKSSPTRQAVWHAKAIERHLQAIGLTVPVTAIVVFVDPDWICHEESGCAVLAGVRGLLRHLTSQEADHPLSPARCKEVAETLARSFSLHAARESADTAEPASRPETEGTQEAIEPAHGPPSGPANDTSGPATQKQREYVAALLARAGLRPASGRLDALTRAQSQAVIDRLRFHREVDLPTGLRAAE